MLIEQRSKEWFNIRKGKITSSEVHKIMGEGKGKEVLTDTAKTYLLEKISESLGGFTTLATGAAIEWGTELEELACKVYAEKTNVTVDKASFIVYNDNYGGSPDGIVAPDGVIEIKCPYVSANHFKHGLIKTAADLKKVAPAYYYQCISNMLCANAKWCDFISFDPRVDECCNMYIFRLERDETEIDNMKNKIETAAKYLIELKNKLQFPTNSVDVAE